ncbi:putative F-box protein At2g02030 [Aegilops tauschii subsp. strangulata]|uniref:putative F-box protein At2g02030 n=1 Tax=Aegilops tauschii subsp. strangulata TaxID=200361 RepID=UPI00098B41A7|nr:F-box/kelch-repeat protein At2g43445-like [Aegilops tauschii subsp. strangulata]
MEQPGKKTGLRIDAHLDEGLVAEVLARLPARCVLRFRAVCKEWLRIIDSPAFLEAHARCRPLELLVYTRMETEVVGPDGLPQAATELDLDAVAVAVPAHRPAPTRRTIATFPDSLDGGLNLYCSLLASCDGLLLIRDAARQYLVLNPATWQWSDLPRLAVQQGGRAVTQESGFYFHQPSGEYRLLCHVSYEYGEFDAQAPHYCVLSTGAKEPRRLMSVQATPMEMEMEETIAYHQWLPPKSRCFMNLMTPAVLHGHLHWLQHVEAGLTGQMVAFDTAAETFRRMPPPPVTCKMHSHLLVADGSLMVAELGHRFMDLWFLEGYGGGAAEGTWEHRHRVDMRWPITGPLLVAGGDGGDVVLGHNQGVVAYNLRSRTVRQVVDVDESGDEPLLLPSRYVFRESLVRHGFFEERKHPGLPSFRCCP